MAAVLSCDRLRILSILRGEGKPQARPPCMPAQRGLRAGRFAVAARCLSLRESKTETLHDTDGRSREPAQALWRWFRGAEGNVADDRGRRDPGLAWPQWRGQDDADLGALRDHHADRRSGPCRRA